MQILYCQLNYNPSCCCIVELWQTIAKEKIASCHFEYSGSIYTMNICTDGFVGKVGNYETVAMNTDESAVPRTRFLKVL